MLHYIVPDMVQSPWRFLILANLAVVLVGLAKSGFGSGLGLMCVPLMVGACWVPTEVKADNNLVLSLALLLPVLIACDYVAIYFWWRRCDWRQLAWLMPGAIVGVYVAWLAFRSLEAVKGGLIITLGVVILALGILQTLRWAMNIGQGLHPRPWHGVATGAVAGFTSMIGHSAGPIIAMFLLPQNLDKAVFVGTSAMFFFLVNQLKLIPQFALGRIQTVPVWTVISLLPAVLGGSYLGKYLDEKVSQRVFNAVAYVAIIASGVILLWMGFMQR